jgi:carboxyl-terminal processing protease
MTEPMPPPQTPDDPAARLPAATGGATLEPAAPEPAAPELMAPRPSTDAVADEPVTRGGAAERPLKPPVSLARRPVLLAAALATVLAGSGLFFAGFALGARTAGQPGTPADETRAFQPFWDAYCAVTQHYAGEPVPHRQVISGAIKGMLESLGDPFSFYMSPEDFKKSLQGLAGQFEGIGATIASRGTDGTEGCSPLGSTCSLVVVQPVPGAPAARAGLRAGDRILKVDGVSVDGSTVDAVIAKVRGPRGTLVTLTVARGSAAPTDVAITRDVIVQPEVVSRELAGGRVGYVQLSGFSDNATRDFVAALRAHIQAGRKAIVLDLRGNLGGYLLGARDVASQFVGAGPIYWEQAAGQQPIASPAAPDGVATDPSIKVAVLVDKNTASASEVVAGAIQDARRGSLVGQQTYGKGTVQEFLALDDDSGGFRLTIARWLTPSQRWINKTGLTPDSVVPLPADGSSSQGDPVLDRALAVLGVAPSTTSHGALDRAA